MEKRLRVDVLPDTFELAKEHAARANISIRDYYDQAVREKVDSEARARRNLQEQRDKRSLDRFEDVVSGLRELTGRFNHAIGVHAKESVDAIKGGFQKIEQTIRSTGGTEHLRTILRDFEKTALAKIGEAFSAQSTAQRKVEETLLGEMRNVRADVLSLQSDRRAQRWRFAVGALTALLCLAALSFLFADTRPTRALAVRLTGNTTAAGAAWTLVGDGRTSGELLAKTRALVNGDERFAAAYAACLRQAERARAPVSCRLSVPSLRVAP